MTRQSSAGLVVHTDQGSQYASDDYLSLLAKHEITASMSGRGNCYDNAVYGERFLTRHEAQQVIFEYIECYYSTKQSDATK